MACSPVLPFIYEPIVFDSKKRGDHCGEKDLPTPLKVPCDKCWIVVVIVVPLSRGLIQVRGRRVGHELVQVRPLQICCGVRDEGRWSSKLPYHPFEVERAGCSVW